MFVQRLDKEASVSETQPTGELQATGIVIAHHSRRSSQSFLIHPVVRFETQDGRTVEFESATGSNMAPKVGEEVTVLYDPLRPEEAKLSLGSTFRFRSQTFVIVGVLALFVVLLPVLAFILLILWATL
jgi:hypothetical protein